MIRSFSALVHLHAVVSLVCCLELEITQNGTYSLWIYYSVMGIRVRLPMVNFLILRSTIAF